MEEGALQIYIPYAERLDDIRRSWDERPRLTPASRDRWLTHEEDSKGELSALGDLVSSEANVVPTTFGSLKKQTALKLVVAGYLNAREGIYGPFDYRPKAIPNRTWFEELLRSQKNETRTQRFSALIGKYLTKRSAE